MELEFTDEQHELRSAVRAVLDRECPMTLVRAVVEKGAPAAGAIDALWTRMVGLGWPALTVPEPAGGLGLGWVELAVVLEELGRAVAPVPYLSTVTQYLPHVAPSPALASAVAEGTTGALVDGGRRVDVGRFGHRGSVIAVRASRSGHVRGPRRLGPRRPVGVGR